MCTTLYAGFLESTIIFAMAHFHSIALYLGSHCNTTHSLQSDITKHDLVLASLHVNLSGKNRDHRHIAFLKVSNMQIITLFAFMTLLKGSQILCLKGIFFVHGQDEFGYNAETQKLLCKNGETLLGAINFFVSSINTLVNKTMEDTLMTIKMYENARYAHWKQESI